MTLLQQLDMFFSVQNGLVFAVLCVIGLMVVVFINDKQVINEVQKQAEEVDASYDERVVPAVGTCGCNKEYHFTTCSTSAKDGLWCDMIACNHCPVCNPDMDAMLAEPIAKELHELVVIGMHIEGERATFTFSDSSTAVMRAYLDNGKIEYDAPTPDYRVDTMAQARAIDNYTGGSCIPF